MEWGCHDILTSLSFYIFKIPVFSSINLVSSIYPTNKTKQTKILFITQSYHCCNGKYVKAIIFNLRANFLSETQVLGDPQKTLQSYKLHLFRIHVGIKIKSFHKSLETKTNQKKKRGGGGAWNSSLSERKTEHSSSSWDKHTEPAQLNKAPFPCQSDTAFQDQATRKAGKVHFDAFPWDPALQTTSLLQPASSVPWGAGERENQVCMWRGGSGGQFLRWSSLFSVSTSNINNWRCRRRIIITCGLDKLHASFYHLLLARNPSLVCYENLLRHHTQSQELPLHCWVHGKHFMPSLSPSTVETLAERRRACGSCKDFHEWKSRVNPLEHRVEDEGRILLWSSQEVGPFYSLSMSSPRPRKFISAKAQANVWVGVQHHEYSPVRAYESNGTWREESMNFPVAPNTFS